MDSVEVTIFPGDLDGKESTCNAGFNAWVWKIPWRREWQPTPVFLPGESHGRRSQKHAVRLMEAQMFFFPIKSQIVNIQGFAGQVVCVATTQPCPPGAQKQPRQFVQE